jgi:mannitol-1-/sugar-/sorbitol-6-phosphatase
VSRAPDHPVDANGSAAVGAVELDVEGLLFDLDGVLVDSTVAIGRHWRQFAEWYGLGPDSLLQVTHGRRALDTIVAFADRLPVAPEEAFERYEVLEVEDQEGVVALPGAVELLSCLPSEKWAVVTSGSANVATARLRAAGLPHPQVLVCAQDVVAGKPDPAPYERGAFRLRVAAGQALAVEDAPAGLASARDAGCRTLAVITTHTASELASADFVCAGLSSVKASDADRRLMHLRISVVSRRDLVPDGDAGASLGANTALAKGSPLVN